MTDHIPPEESSFVSVSESMTVEDVYRFLLNHGIPDCFCEAFKDNYIDGGELLGLTEAEVKAMVPPIGIAKKIIRLLPQHQRKASVSELPASDESGPPVPVTPLRRQSSCSSADTVILSPASGSSSSKSETYVPDHWRPEVESCLQEQSLTESARNEMVRALVLQLFARSIKPTRIQCEAVARKLILKYPFLKDDLGNGYQSWVEKMIERVRNVIKRDAKKTKAVVAVDTPEPKRQKSNNDLLRRYPINQSSSSENRESLEMHAKAIEAELGKAKPRDSVLLQLLKSTYDERRMYILNEANSVQSTLVKHRALSRPAVIEQELGLVLGRIDIKSQFLKRWMTQYVGAIIAYGQRSSKKRVADQLENLDETDEVSRQLTALRILFECLTKGAPAMCYLYEEISEIDGIEFACSKTPVRPQPRIVALDSDGGKQYFTVCEMSPLCVLPNLQMAIFITFACYYTFNLEYPSPARNVFFFFQDYILNQPDSNKKSGTYLGVVSDIKRNL